MPAPPWPTRSLRIQHLITPGTVSCRKMDSTQHAVSLPARRFTGCRRPFAEIDGDAIGAVSHVGMQSVPIVVKPSATSLAGLDLARLMAVNGDG